MLFSESRIVALICAGDPKKGVIQTHPGHIVVVPFSQGGLKSADNIRCLGVYLQRKSNTRGTMCY